MIEKYTDALLFEMKDASAFSLLPGEERRAVWERVEARAAQRIVRQAQEDAAAGQVPPLTASGYMNYRKNRDLSGYEQAYHARRQMLRNLTLALCLGADERLHSLLADVIWAICEETSWVLPSNNPGSLGEDAQLLPDPFTPLVDYAAAETAADLSLMLCMIGGTLEKITPQLIRRVVFEVRSRVINPLATYRELEWMCGPRGSIGRCLSGVTLAFLTLEEDGRRRWLCMRKVLSQMDRLLEQLPTDGALPGGLNDWQQTVEPLVDCVQMIYRASAGRVDMRAEQQMQLLCHFPVLCHLARGWFVQPGADALRPQLSGRAMLRIGRFMRDSALCDLGCFLEKSGLSAQEERQTLWHQAEDLLSRQELEDMQPRPPFRREGYLPSWPMMVARLREDETAGLAVAMHGGSNRRVDGHADVGDILIFAGDKPVLTDGAGRSSEWHNLPTVGGICQGMGAACRAQDVICELEENYSTMSMNLAGAYPAHSAVYSWQRTLVFDRTEGSARLMEIFDLKGFETVHFHFITPQEPRLGPGYAQLGPVRMRWDAELTPQVEQARLPNENGEGALYRLTLAIPQPVNSGQYSFTFTPLRTFG